MAEMIAMLNGLQPGMTRAQAASLGVHGCAGCGDGLGAPPRSPAYYAQMGRRSLYSGQYEGMSVSDQVKIQKAAPYNAGPISPEQAMFMAKSGQFASTHYSPNLAAMPMPIRDYEMAVRSNTIASGTYRAQSIIGNPLNTVTLGGVPMTPAVSAALARRGQIRSGQWAGTLSGLGAEDTEKKGVSPLVIAFGVGAVLYALYG